MVPLGLAAMKKHLAIVTVIVNSLLEGNKFTAKQFKVEFLMYRFLHGNGLAE